MSSRLHVNVNDATALALRELAAKHQTTVTEVVRRSVGTYAFFRGRQQDGVAIQLSSQHIVTEVLIP